MVSELISIQNTSSRVHNISGYWKMKWKGLYPYKDDFKIKRGKHSNILIHQKPDNSIIGKINTNMGNTPPYNKQRYEESTKLSIHGDIKNYVTNEYDGIEVYICIEYPHNFSKTHCVLYAHNSYYELVGTWIWSNPRTNKTIEGQITLNYIEDKENIKP